MIPVLSWVRGSETIAAKKGLGVLSGFLGASLVVTRGQFVSLGQTQFLGDVLILGTAVTIAVGFFYSKKPTAQKRGRAGPGGKISLPKFFFVLPVPLDPSSSL